MGQLDQGYIQSNLCLILLFYFSAISELEEFKDTNIYFFIYVYCYVI